MPSPLTRRRFLGAVGAGAATIGLPGIAGAAPPPGRGKKPRTYTRAFTEEVGLRDIAIVVGPPPVASEIINQPAQPWGFCYTDFTADLSAYEAPGALVVAGRVNYGNTEFQQVSAAGGHVLIYLDAIIDASYGTYHSLLHGASIYGAATDRWPGMPGAANSTGWLVDFRVGSVLQSKLEPVLQQMVSDNPHMAGFFADDVGSRSWFPNLNWSTDFTATERQEYRDGALAVVQTFRDVCDQHGLMFLVNGTWAGLDGLTFEERGGGYPDIEVNGHSLADGGYVEQHVLDSFWTNYADPATSQWATQSPLTQGSAFMCAANPTNAERDAYITSGVYAYAVTQTEANYQTPPAPWGSFHPTGLPTQVT